MQAVKTIGLDIAESGFQVHGVDADGQVVFRRQLKRRYILAFFGGLVGTAVLGQIFDRFGWWACVVGIALALATAAYLALRLRLSSA